MLSVIIATSPGRQKHLHYCLEALSRQTYGDFEVLISDDGSEGMSTILAPFEARFQRLEYLWRPADRNLSRSRNLGAAQARGSGLVFLNTDVLLNPQALAAYQQALQSIPQATLWGYVGCRKAVSAPSLWFPEQRVNWLDFRFFPLSAQTLHVHPGFQTHPHRLAGGHHFALTRQAFEQLGPMNEAFQDWGEEDVEYALRGLIQGLSMCLLGDVWGEHLVHPYDEHFHLEASLQNQLKQKRLTELEQALQSEKILKSAKILFGSELSRLNQIIQSHYLTYHPDALVIEQSRRG